MIRFSPNPNRAHLIDWVEWGPEAFEEARRQNKLIMLYLHAFWCGICHRMDEGAFSSDENIALVNGFFIPLRVEDAQRPDIDVRYNQNGWPTIAFITPDGDHLGNVNYLPPEEFGNVLSKLHMNFREGKSVILKSNEQVKEGGFRKIWKGQIKSGINESSIANIANILMVLTDKYYGGFGPSHKFPHSEAMEFFIDWYDRTQDTSFLNHVILTLDKMRDSEIHDSGEGGFFRYSTNADWSQPHREKLLVDQAGLLKVCLRSFSILKRLVDKEIAEEIIGYLNTSLSDISGATFCGCQDYLQPIRKEDVEGREIYIPLVDGWLYTDANAQVIDAYLSASIILDRPDCLNRALNALTFLWNRCRDRKGGMYHYYDGEPHVSGLLIDQVHMGLALLHAYRVTQEMMYLDRAKDLAAFILKSFRNLDGGFYDTAETGIAHLRFRLTLLVQNGSAATFFLYLSESAKEESYREEALWALKSFSGDFEPYGVYAAQYGRALAAYIDR